MPRLIVKMYAVAGGAKQKLAEALTKAVMAVTGNGEDSVSVSVEDSRRPIGPKGHEPDIENGSGKL